MKHRSPVVTLATVLVAFVIMFTVNMLSGPPGRSSAGTADVPVGSAGGSAALQLDSENPQVTVEGENLDAKLVSGDEGL